MKKKSKSDTVSPPKELTKKQELNNYIVCMRKSVRKSRVHVINKLIKAIKRLQERKGSEKDKEKSKRKAERLLEEIHILKRLNKDKVSVFALQNKIPLGETLQDAKSSVEDKALARVAHSKCVQVEVQKFREKNPYWELQIPVLLERSKEKLKKQRKKLEQKQALTKPEFKPESKVEPESDKHSDAESVASVDDNPSDSETEDTADKPVQKPKKILLPKVQKVELKKQKKVLPEKKAQVKKPIPQLNKSEGTLRIQLIKDLADLEDSESEEGKITTEEETHIGTNKLPKSAFFVGGVDEPEEEPEDSRRSDYNNRERRPQQNSWGDSSEYKPIFKKGKLVTKKPDKGRRGGFGGGGRETLQKPRAPRYFEKLSTTSSNFTPVGESGPSSFVSRAKQVENPGAAEKLHPSWEAKKRQTVSIPAFKGTKITFGDDD